MSLIDPIADMLTRMRNAHMSGHDITEVPYSNMKGEIARILKKEGFIKDYAVEGGNKKVLRIYLKYTESRDPAIRGVKRLSKPGLRRYAVVDKLPQVLNGMGIAIVSTSSGIMTAKEARKQRIGGEILCSIW